MALLTAGYWPTTYWIDSYWFDNYWQNYGTSNSSGACYLTEEVIDQIAEAVWNHNSAKAIKNLLMAI